MADSEALQDAIKSVLQDKIFFDALARKLNPRSDKERPGPSKRTADEEDSTRIEHIQVRNQTKLLDSRFKST